MIPTPLRSPRLFAARYSISGRSGRRGRMEWGAVLLAFVVGSGLALPAATTISAPDAAAFVQSWETAPSTRPWALSPDGTRVATIEDDGAILWLRLISLADRSERRFPVGEVAPGKALPVGSADLDESLRFFRPTGSVIEKLVEDGISNSIRRLHWKTDHRLVFWSSMGSLLWAVNDDGSDPAMLLTVLVEGSESRQVTTASREILDLLPDAPDRILVQARAFYFDRAAMESGVIDNVFLVDVNTGNAAALLDGELRGMIPLVDRLGYVRGGLKPDYDQLTLELHFLDETTGKVTSATERYGADQSRREALLLPLPYAAIHDRRCLGWQFDPSVLYVVRPTETGRSGLFALDVATGIAGPAALESVEFDFASGAVVADSFRRSVIGFRYPDTTEKTVWFDPLFEQVQAAVDAALPQRTNRITDWNRERTRFLFRTYSDRDLGGVGLYEIGVDGGKLQVLSPLEPRAGAASRTAPIWLPTATGPMLCYLTSAKSSAGADGPPLVVMIGNAPDDRSEWVFDLDAAYLAASGYSVLRVNPHELSGFVSPGGRPVAEALLRRVIDDTVQATKWAIDAGVADPRRVHLIGSGYGSYAALMLVAEQPQLFASAIVQQPVTDVLAWMSEQPGGVAISSSGGWAYQALIEERWGNPKRDKAGLRRRSPDRVAEKKLCQFGGPWGNHEWLWAYGLALRKWPMSNSAPGALPSNRQSASSLAMPGP